MYIQKQAHQVGHLQSLQSPEKEKSPSGNGGKEGHNFGQRPGTHKSGQPSGIKAKSTGQLSMDQFIKNTDKKFKTSL